MSISNSYPTQKAILNLDFANSGKLDSRISFSRTDTPATYAAPSAVHYWSNEKHKSSENLLQYSNPITSHWSEINTVITTGSVAAPDGTTTASKVLETSATGYHETRETFSCTNAVSHTATFYAKANGRTVIRFLPRTSSGVIANVEFTLSGTGSESLISGTATRSIAAVGSAGGWYKMTVTFAGNATATGDFQINICESAGTDSYAGDATKGVYIWGCQVSSTGETVFNSTSGSIHREFAPTLKSVTNAGDPRFEYSPADGQSEGLLIESQYTQYAHYSEEFDNNGGWAKVNASIQPNSAVAPDGTLSADLLVEAYEASGTNAHYIQQNTLSSVAVGETYTWTVFAKAAGRSSLAIYSSIGGANVMGYWNLTDGSVTTTSGTGLFSSKDCGNGWYRLEMTFTTTTTSGGGNYFYTVNGGVTGYPGNGYGSVLLWGANLTKTASSMSYVKAESSTVTKSADSCSVATSSFYTGGPVTVVGEIAGTGSGYSALFELRDTVSKAAGINDYMMVWKTNATDTNASNFSLYIYDKSTLQAGPTISGSGGATTIAARLDTNNVRACADGGTVATDTSAVIPDSLDTLYIGRGYSGYELGSTIKRLAVYNVALSDTELQAITS